MSAGQVITGGSVSFTVTVNEHSARIPSSICGCTGHHGAFLQGKRFLSIDEHTAVTPGQLSLNCRRRIVNDRHLNRDHSITVMSAGQVITRRFGIIYRHDK